MRIYIIGNAGITLCREPPAAVNEGEIAVASGSQLTRWWRARHSNSRFPVRERPGRRHGRRTSTCAAL
jgi:hypothetical protein